MTKKAFVTDISESNEIITVLPLQKDECTTCTAGCAKNSETLEVSNPNNLTIKKGSLVVISSSKKAQAVQGIFSLLLPVCCAIFGYFIAKPFMTLFNIAAQDGIKALFVLGFLILSAATVYFITRKHSIPGKAQIVEVL